ncbi:hypothetical protein [Nostoc sp. PCC 7107]|uniref:hypothetical protein n=1 Tax=Nostoc sp. PCC 7107 TaxID=317936 RepID=UPI00029F2EE4|nr:hypothetical protein [Nostoc sp. PCC 7107]AFY45738.1 hypothetical protein Nos7107_5237 [Nostoc sp. PCC 7107]
MDTAADLLFLNEEVALRINSFSEGEYLVIQTYPQEKSLKVSKRSFDYNDAKQYCELEGLSHDYATFELRIIRDNKLWTVNNLGYPRTISQQQDWKVSPEYFEAIKDNDNYGEIIVCFCSYPYFHGEAVECWHSVTCLVDDHGREIHSCPNCHISLVDELDDNSDDFYEQITQPAVCIGCANYHGQEYAEELLICAVHPYGWDGVSCPDFAVNNN